MLLLTLLTTVTVGSESYKDMGAPKGSKAGLGTESSTGSNASSRPSSANSLNGTVNGRVPRLNLTGNNQTSSVPTEAGVRGQIVNMRSQIQSAQEKDKLSEKTVGVLQNIEAELSGLENSTDWEASAELIRKAHEQVEELQRQLTALIPVSEEEGTRGHNSSPALRPVTAAFGFALSPGGNHGNDDNDPFADADA